MPPRNEEEVLRLNGSLIQAASENGSERREYEIRMIKAGRVRAAGNRESNIEIPIEPLRSALYSGMFNGLAVFVDHSGWFEYPKTQRLAASTFDSWIEEDGVYGKIRLYDTPLANALGDMFDNMLEDGESGPDVGFSLVFYPKWKPRDNYEDPLILDSIKHIESVDFVFEPGADGRLIAQLSAHFNSDYQSDVQIKEIEEMPPRIENEAHENGTPENETLQAPEPAEQVQVAPQVDMWLNAVQRQSTSAILAASAFRLIVKSGFEAQNMKAPKPCKLPSMLSENISLRCKRIQWWTWEALPQDHLGSWLGCLVMMSWSKQRWHY